MKYYRETGDDSVSPLPTLGYRGIVMNKKIIFKAILDGFISSFVLNCLGIFLVSIYASNLSLEQCLLIGFLTAMLFTTVFAMLMLKESSNKAIMCYSLISIVSFAFFVAIMMVFQLTFKFDFMIIRETNNADGILLIFTIVCFVLSSVLLRACAFILLIIRNAKKNRETRETGDGSVSPLR